MLRSLSFIETIDETDVSNQTSEVDLKHYIDEF